MIANKDFYFWPFCENQQRLKPFDHIFLEQYFGGQLHFAAHVLHNGVLVWCSYLFVFWHCWSYFWWEERFIFLIIVFWSGAPAPIISWNVLHQCGYWAPPFVIICSSGGQYPTTPPPPNGSNWVASVVEGVGEQIRPLFSIIQPLGPPSPSKPRCPPQGLGLPPTIWAARRPPQESPSCSRAPQNHPGFQNTNQPNNQFKSGS